MLKQVPQLGKKARVYDGTAWQELASAQTDLTAYSTTAQMNTAITAGSGLKFITGASFTTATSVSLPNDTFTSAYRNYKMILTISAVTADADFSVRLRAAGTDNTASSYDTMMYGGTATGSTSGYAGTSLTSFRAAESDATAVRYSWNFDILQPQVAALTFFSGSFSYVNKSNTEQYAMSGQYNFKTTTQFDSLSFISSVASSITGTYRVYGYSDSQAIMTNPLIQIGDEVRPMTDDEYSQWQIDNTEIEARQAEADAVVATRSSALAKLAAIGLTPEEIASL